MDWTASLCSVFARLRRSFCSSSTLAVNIAVPAFLIPTGTGVEDGVGVLLSFITFPFVADSALEPFSTSPFISVRFFFRFLLEPGSFFNE